MENRYINREISWLDFNARVLQEAADSKVPLIERLRFLGIFSNNLDEFFQVRYATVKRIAQSEKSGKKVLGGIKAETLLEQITRKVIRLQKQSLEILNAIEQNLQQENIYFIDETHVSESEHAFLREYFLKHVSPALVTVILAKDRIQDFTDNTAFLTVKMTLEKDSEPTYALIELKPEMDRFIVLPKLDDGRQNIMLLDDLIRYHFHLIFSFFNYQSIEGHMIKVTRDAELDLEEDASKSYVDKISESVKDRMFSDPVRMVYDNTIGKDTLDFVMQKLKVTSTDSLIPGGRYHHRRDYMKFPSLGRNDLLYDPIEPLPVAGLNIEQPILKRIQKQDYLLHTPYQDFSYVVKFLREAALDPRVQAIKLTVYRLSKLSHVVSALINASKNGKKVLVQIELQARFDEENNIEMANKLEAAGIQLIFGVPGLKVHAKICVIERLEKKKIKRYGFISTGNFNESTAKVYTDFTLFTFNQKILKEVNKVFNFLEVNYKLKTYKHLIVSPHYTRTSVMRLIDQEIANKKAGLPSGIKMKLNNLTSYKIIDKFYEASRAGVPIQLMIRGICCLIPGIKGMSETIEVLGVIDRFLEHSRVFIFENAGQPKIYISSADMMTRNIENRVEVACPIYALDLQQQIQDSFAIGWQDNVKGRRINGSVQNQLNSNTAKTTRSQQVIYSYIENLVQQCS
ncbi:MAG: polyphosphate kinase 1 [Flavobacteriaceae bacterium]